MVEIKISKELVKYEESLKLMEERVGQIILGKDDELIWYLEHPSIYTAGTSANDKELLDEKLLPVFYTGRGGKYTYHGPGQRIIYLMLDLKRRACPNQPDIRKFVWDLEEWIIKTLLEFGIKGERRQDRVGIWVKDKNIEAKIAALGIRVKKWVTYHGVAVNINPNLNYFNGIIPCGLKQYGVTSFEQLGVNATFEEIDDMLKKNFSLIFG